MKSYLLSTLSLILCVGTVQADMPVSSHLFPAGGQVGTTVNFHAAGLNLNRQCEIEITGKGIEYPSKIERTDSPWFEGPVLPLPESQRQENYPKAMAARVKVNSDAPTGDRFVFLRTSQGYTSPLKFVVGTLPELIEQEVDGDEPAKEVRMPMTINGRIFPREDVDLWSVNLEANKTIHARVDSARLGYPLEAKLVLRDPKGLVVAEAVNKGSLDPSLTFRSKSAGIHTLSITDARGEGGPAFVYRLTLSEEEQATGSAQTFPNSVRQHSDNVDPIKGNVLTVPSSGAGCIDTPGKTNQWSFSGRKGVPLEIALKSRSIGSPLLGRISLADVQGRILLTADAGNSEQLDPILKWTPPADGMYLVTVSDLFARRGGKNFKYQLEILSPIPDFEVSFASSSLTVFRASNATMKMNLTRKGSFDGPVHVAIEGLPSGVTVPKDLQFAKGQNSIDVSFSATNASLIVASKLKMTGTAIMPMIPFTAMPMMISHRAVWKEAPEIDSIRMLVALPTPFKIAADYELKLIPRGTVYIRKFQIARNGFDGPIEIELADNQARHLQGVSGPKLTIPPGQSAFDYPLTLPPFMETGRTSRTCVMGTATLKEPNGSEHVVNYSSRDQNDQIIAVVEPERLSLRAENLTLRIENGSTATIGVTARRGIGLSGPIEVVAAFRSPSIECPKLVLDAKSETGRLTFKSLAKVKTVTPVAVLMRATIRDENGRPVTAEQSVIVYLVP